MEQRRDYALITGASGGLGESFARALAARGRNLILVARSTAKLDQLARELSDRHAIEAKPVPFDLSEPGAGGRLAEMLAARGLAVDLLVNNAGFGAKGEFWKLSYERQAEMIRLNIVSLMELTHRLVPAMVERRRGGLVNVSSTAGFQPIPFTAAYAASKAFVTSFSLALEEELGPHGVRVVTLCPGGTATNFFEASQYGQRTMPGGLQPPQEVVAAALARLDAGGGLVVPRLLNKAMVFVQRFVPRSWPMWVAGRMFRPR